MCLSMFEVFKRMILVYEKDLEDEIKGETGSPFKEFLVEVLDRPKFNESGTFSNQCVIH